MINSIGSARFLHLTKMVMKNKVLLFYFLFIMMLMGGCVNTSNHSNHVTLFHHDDCCINDRLKDFYTDTCYPVAGETLNLAREVVGEVNILFMSGGISGAPVDLPRYKLYIDGTEYRIGMNGRIFGARMNEGIRCRVRKLLEIIKNSDEIEKCIS